MSVAQEFKQRLEAFLANPQEFVEKLSEEQKDQILNDFKERTSNAFRKAFFEVYKGRNPVASNLGKCDRMLAFQYHGYPAEPLEPSSKMTFLFGDLIEAAVYAIAASAAWEISSIQEVVDVDGIRGRIDGLAKEGVLFDAKTASKASFEIAKRAGGVTDDFGYLTQINIYRKGVEAEEQFFLYVCKDNGKIEVFEASVSDDLVELAKQKRQLVLDSTPDRLPPRPYTPVEDKKTKQLCLPMACKFCNYKSLCWNIVKVDKGYNNSEVHVVDEKNPFKPVDPALAEPVSSS